MFKKILISLILALMCFANVYAQDKKMGWQLDLKKVALNLSSTDVKNSTTYKDFPNTRLTSDSQTLVQGTFNMSGDYFGDKFVWANTILAEYGKNTIKPAEGERTVNESVDHIIISTDYTLRLWHIKNFMGGFEAGPFISLAYQTEFNAQADSPLKKVVRGSLGAKLFEGKFLKSLYAAGFMEGDFTYPQEAAKYGWETGFKVEVPVRDGVKAQFSGLFRNYLSESVKQQTDIDYEAELDARLDVMLFNNFSLAPFINYYTAQGKYVGPRGQNLYIGISFGFSKILIPAKNS